MTYDNIKLFASNCYNLCFGPTPVDFYEKIPPDLIISNICPYLNLHELGQARSLSRSWNVLASEPILWKAAIYREFAFSSKNWAQLDADLVKDVDMRQEMLLLPDNIAEELRRSALYGKSIKETHVLVMMPKGLTINKLGELAKKFFAGNGYKYICPEVVENLGDKPADESVWLLMTITNVVDGTKGESYIEQQNIIAELAKKALVPYEVPTTLDAATCILAEYFRSKRRLFNNIPGTFTCTRGQKNAVHPIGCFGKDGLIILSNNPNCGYGVAALRKINAS